MDDLNLEKALQNYYKSRSQLQISETCKERLNNLTAKPKHTKIHRRILQTQIMFVFFFIILVPTTAYATASISNALQQKLKDANLSSSQISTINKEINERGFTEEKIKNMDPLKVNKHGQTYGPEAFNPDLIAVISDEGFNGYVYSKDMYPEMNFKSPEEALEWQKIQPLSFDVYKCDGTTVIGKFTAGNR